MFWTDTVFVRLKFKVARPVRYMIQAMERFYYDWFSQPSFGLKMNLL